MEVEVVGTDRVDEGSPHTPSHRRHRAGARAEDLHTGVVIQTGGRVALGCVVGGGEVLSDTVQSPLL